MNFSYKFGIEQDCIILVDAQYTWKIAVLINSVCRFHFLLIIT